MVEARLELVRIWYGNGVHGSLVVALKACSRSTSVSKTSVYRAHCHRKSLVSWVR